MPSRISPSTLPPAADEFARSDRDLQLLTKYGEKEGEQEKRQRRRGGGRVGEGDLEEDEERQ